jgi:hypothetical protein
MRPIALTMTARSAFAVACLLVIALAAAITPAPAVATLHPATLMVVSTLILVLPAAKRRPTPSVSRSVADRWTTVATGGRDSVPPGQDTRWLAGEAVAGPRAGSEPQGHQAVSPVTLTPALASDFSRRPLPDTTQSLLAQMPTCVTLEGEAAAQRSLNAVGAQ